MTWRLTILTACSLFLFTACNDHRRTEENTATDSSAAIPARTDTTSVNTPPKGNDTATISEYIKDSMPEWSVPSSDTWERYWFERYKKGKNTVYRVQEDFDGNGNTDYGFILKDTSDHYAVWAFLAKDNSYTPYRIYDITRLPDRKLHVGLDVLKTGSYSDLNSTDSIPAKVQTGHPAIHVVFFETAAKAYYWKDGSFHLIQTGD